VLTTSNCCSSDAVVDLDPLTFSDCLSDTVEALYDFSLSQVVLNFLFFQQCWHSGGLVSRLHDMLPVPASPFTCFTTDS
jgi:hypothetical protein